MYEVTPQRVEMLCELMDRRLPQTQDRTIEQAALIAEESEASRDKKLGLAKSMEVMQHVNLGKITLAQGYFLSQAHFAMEFGMSPENFVAAWRERFSTMDRACDIDKLLNSNGVAMFWPWK